MNAAPLYDRLKRDLDQRREDSLFRTVPSFRDVSEIIDLSTNSYLGLQNNKYIREEAEKLTGKNYTGNLASRLVAQYSPLFDELESEIASWKGTDAALIFNSGYAANVGILQALCTRDTEVFCDRLNHASIYDGIKLSGCKLSRYKHIDMSDLEHLLKVSSSKEKIIITDSVFSMDGDCAPLSDIVELAQRFQCFVIIDEAHATGIFGNHCSGLAEACGVSDQIDIIMGTFSKALAGYGGFVAVSSLLRDYLVNSSRSFIYSTALPHSVLAHDLAAVRYVRNHPEKGASLIEKSNRFRSSVKSSLFSCGSSTTQIIPLITGTEQRAIALKSYLQNNGIIAPAIRPPTVPAGTARVRVSLHNGLTDLQLETVLSVLSSWDGN